MRASRKLSLDGREVVYDLRFGVDFTNPRRAAEAIAQVVWEEDASAWWSVTDAGVVCTPTRTVTIWVPSEHNRRIAKAVQEFRHDLRDHELADAVSSYLDSRENREADWGMIFFMGPLWAYLLQSHDNKVRRQEELGKLFATMAGHIRLVGAA